MPTYNLYCDESSHLEHDRHRFMVLGAIWCESGKAREVSSRLRAIKTRHGLWPRFEVKWTKVSPALLGFYQDYLDHFFNDDDLHFRALIADKTGLRHDDFAQTHDEWYYKMYFNLLKTLIGPHNRYRIYLDVKDTRGGSKVAKLHEVLSNNLYDFQRRTIKAKKQRSGTLSPKERTRPNVFPISGDANGSPGPGASSMHAPPTTYDCGSRNGGERLASRLQRQTLGTSWCWRIGAAKSCSGLPLWWNVRTSGKNTSGNTWLGAERRPKEGPEKG